MKKVLQDFDRQTSQRFKEYDERMIDKRQKCKEQCDKDIKKIILKDKIEKELTEKFSTLDTNITTTDIPTCVCEKSVADKVEKTCLKCGVLGGGIAPSWGLVSSIVYTGWKAAALAAATKEAVLEGAAKGLAEVEAMGFANFFEGMKSTFFMDELNVQLLKPVFIQQNPSNFSKLAHFIHQEYQKNCGALASNDKHSMCQIKYIIDLGAKPGQAKVSEEILIGGKVNDVLVAAKNAAANETANVIASETAVLETAKKSAIETTYMGYQTTIIASVVAILVIVLVMVIIYLILRYRRKKKMKKKLQYIKLLKE